MPTLKEAIGIDWTIGAWRGIAGPKGLPDEVDAKLEPALKKVYDSEEYKELHEPAAASASAMRRPAEFEAFMAQARRAARRGR